MRFPYPWVWLADRFDYRGCWSFPILATGGTFIGSLAIYSEQPRSATQRELELASLLTQTASLIIAREQEQQARQRAERALDTRRRPTTQVDSPARRSASR